MRILVVGLGLIFLCGSVSPQVKQTRIMLSPNSNISTSQVAEGFAKYCPNVTLTQNESKADYVLEAAETVTADEGTTYSHWHFTLLSKDGDVLMTTHPEMHWGSKTKHHFESICKYVGK
jgi:hypothetical protein